MGVHDRFPEWDDFSFDSLNREALQQRDAVEAFRMQAAGDSLNLESESTANTP